MREGKGCRWQGRERRRSEGDLEEKKGEYDEGEKGLREGALEELREELQKRSPLLYCVYRVWIPLYPLGLPISGPECSLSAKSFDPVLPPPGSGAQKGWPVTLLGVGGGNIFPLWPSLLCPCLLSLDNPSDSVYLLSSGRTVIGSAARDISLQGPGLAPEHCYIENLRGTLTLYPCGNACTIDGLPVQQPTRLTQGKV